LSRLLGLDIGKRRIGVALSDETQTIAKGLEAVDGTAKKEPAIRRIADICAENDVSEIVAGLPLNMDGSEGPAAKEVLGFVELLSQELSVPILTYDERLSTKQGEAILIKADMSRSKRKKTIDRFAAQIILQAYLDQKRSEEL